MDAGAATAAARLQFGVDARQWLMHKLARLRHGRPSAARMCRSPAAAARNNA